MWSTCTPTEWRDATQAAEHREAAAQYPEWMQQSFRRLREATEFPLPKALDHPGGWSHAFGWSTPVVLLPAVFDEWDDTGVPNVRRCRLNICG